MFFLMRPERLRDLRERLYEADLVVGPTDRNEYRCWLERCGYRLRRDDPLSIRQHVRDFPAHTLDLRKAFDDRGVFDGAHDPMRAIERPLDVFKLPGKADDG